jgi:hypothetical protein
MNTLVRMSVEPSRTRVLITQGPTDIGKVVLPLSFNPHPRAMATLLEGLSLCLNERLSVVLCVDESSSSCGSVGLLDALGYGERNPFYEVAVAVRASRASRRGGGCLLQLAGGGDFRDLRQLTVERAQ